MTFTPRLDARFGDIGEPLDWNSADDVLRTAELYWLTTVRGDGRPHVTPLVGVWLGDEFAFCTGPSEQKYRNLESNPAVVITTGSNTWQDGLDVVVEGVAVRVTGYGSLRKIADAFRDKYSGAWDYENDDDVFRSEGVEGHVFGVRAAKVIAFAKSPHGQTTFTP